MQMARLQVSGLLMTLLLAYLCGPALRGPSDYRALGRLVVAAGCVRALHCIYTIATIVPRPETASSHGDSVLFAVAFALVIIRFAEQPGWGTAGWSTLILPLLGWGMIANDRRLVWVEVAAALLLYFATSRRSSAKRRVTRLLIGLSPLILVYILAGWNSQSGVFAPVQALRSTGAFGQDPQVDGSTLYRDTENYNLMTTMRTAPLFGVGFGQPFIEFIKLPDISFFKEYSTSPITASSGCGRLPVRSASPESRAR